MSACDSNRPATADGIGVDVVRLLFDVDDSKVAIQHSHPETAFPLYAGNLLTGIWHIDPDFEGLVYA